MGVKPTDDEIRSLLSEIDLTYHGQLELQDYLQVEISHKYVEIWYSWDNNRAIVVFVLHVSYGQGELFVMSCTLTPGAPTDRLLCIMLEM